MSIQPQVSRTIIMQPNTQGRGAPGRQRGIALFIGLVFLVMLTLVSLIVMRGTLLEMRMTTATARHEQAFEASETARTVPESILASHVFNRGWPESWGGNVPDVMFNLNTVFANRLGWSALLNPNTTSGQGLQPSSCGSGMVIFYMAVTCPTRTASYNYTPSIWSLTPSVKFTLPATQTQDVINIVRDGVTVNQGSGAASQQGYASVGVGTSKGGSALLLQVQSTAVVSGSDTAGTIAQYKLNITN
jgi:PilX N-terminal